MRGAGSVCGCWNPKIRRSVEDLASYGGQENSKRRRKGKGGKGWGAVDVTDRSVTRSVVLTVVGSFLVQRRRVGDV